MGELIQIAKQYAKAGLSVIPCKSNKKPMLNEWTTKKNTIASVSEIEGWRSKNFPYLAVICGEVSGNLICIDVDQKHDPTETISDRFWERVVDYFKQQPPPIPAVTTPSGGMHLIFKTDVPVLNNTDLAKLESTKGAIIETRGEGGYFVAYPSEGYKLFHGDMLNIPVLPESVYTDLIDIARSFNEVFYEVKDKKRSGNVSNYKDTPWEHYDQTDDYEEILIEAGWTKAFERGKRVYWKRPDGAIPSENDYHANFHKEKRVFYVFSPNTPLSDVKGYDQVTGQKKPPAFTPSQIFTFLKCGGNFSKAGSELHKLGYGKEWTKEEEALINQANEILTAGHSEAKAQEEIASVILTSGSTKLDKPERYVEAAKNREPVGEFWKLNRKKYELDYRKLGVFLKKNGYVLLVNRRDDKKKPVAKIDNDTHIIKIMPRDEMKKDLERLVYDIDLTGHNISYEDIMELLVNVPTQKWEGLTEWFPNMVIEDIPTLRDTENTVFLPFEDGIVKITMDDIVMMEYDELPDGVFVWESQIKKHRVKIFDVVDDTGFAVSNVWKFFRRICGLTEKYDDTPYHELVKEHPDLAKRYVSLLTFIGYLSSNYKSPSNPYIAVFLEDTEDSADGGGMGKGIILKALGQIRKVVEEDGKTFDLTDKFAFSNVDLSTDIFAINDAKKNFNVESFNTFITDSFKVEQKYGNKFTIPFELSPKITVNTNYDVKAVGSHGKRRTRKFVLHKHFGVDHQPKDEFNEEFFNHYWDANPERWTAFFNVMFYAIQQFLNHGLVTVADTPSVINKRLTMSYGEEFMSFMDWYVTDGDDLGDNIVYQKLYDLFISRSKKSEYKYDITYFMRGVRDYLEAKKIPFEDKIKSTTEQILGENRYGKGLYAIKIKSSTTVFEDDLPF